MSEILSVSVCTYCAQPVVRNSEGVWVHAEDETEYCCVPVEPAPQLVPMHHRYGGNEYGYAG